MKRWAWVILQSSFVKCTLCVVVMAAASMAVAAGNIRFEEGCPSTDVTVNGRTYRQQIAAKLTRLKKIQVRVLEEFERVAQHKAAGTSPLTAAQTAELKSFEKVLQLPDEKIPVWYANKVKLLERATRQEIAHVTSAMIADKADVDGIGQAAYDFLGPVQPAEPIERDDLRLIMFSTIMKTNKFQFGTKQMRYLVAAGSIYGEFLSLQTKQSKTAADESRLDLLQLKMDAINQVLIPAVFAYQHDYYVVKDFRHPSRNLGCCLAGSCVSCIYNRGLREVATGKPAPDPRLWQSNVSIPRIPGYEFEQELRQLLDDPGILDERRN